MNKKIAFCFLSHSAHIRHQLPIAANYSILNNVQVDLLCTTQAAKQELCELLSIYPGHRCKLIFLKGSLFKKISGYLKRRLYPNIRDIIRNNKALFLSYDALVTPHHNLDQVMAYDSNRNIKYICTFHGAGDGDIGFDRRFADYDLLLTAGEETRGRLISEGLVHKDNDVSIIGYPKLDGPLPNVAALFDNGKPIFIYNPHYAAHWQSWGRFGIPILEFFRKNKNWNLIFAPHVKLFNGRASKELDLYRAEPNIHIDTSSLKLMDASYTRLADVYIGDGSSQVYEFLYFSIKPVLFLDAHGVQDWLLNPNYKMWQMGPVINSSKQFATVISSVFDDHKTYIEIQKSMLQSRFSKKESSAGERGAQSIASFLGVGV